MINFIENLFKAYPQLKAAALTLAVALAARFGFHVTPDWFLGVISAAVTLFHMFAAAGASRAKREAAESAAKAAVRSAR